jgi:hypothetical protein
MSNVKHKLWIVDQDSIFCVQLYQCFFTSISVKWIPLGYDKDVQHLSTLVYFISIHWNWVPN